jgi:hypothetical protein
MSSTKLLKQTIGLILVVLLVGCQPNPTAIPITPTATSPPPTEYKYTFETFPDGADISGGTTRPDGLEWQSLDGDEFSEWGFDVASAPVSSCVIVRTSYYSSPHNYLALLDGGNCLNVRRIEITFLEPVLEVELAFSGASEPYVMEVYNGDGELLGSPIQEAEFDEEGKLFPISFSSDNANISRISFGVFPETVTAVVAIREIRYVR